MADVNGVLDAVFVGVVLAVSVGYAAYALGPRALRQRLLSALAASMLRLPAAAGLHPLARRLKDAAAAASGGCGACGDCAVSPKPTAAGPPDREVRVPLSSVGRRR